MDSIYCATVEEIVAKEEGIETTTLFVFPQLTTLTLRNLPELKEFLSRKAHFKVAIIETLRDFEM